MSAYRIVRIANVCHYKEIATFIENELEGREDLSYDDRLDKLFDSHLAYSNSFSRAMRSLGHDAHEIVYDCKPVQIQWTVENGVAFDKENWEADITLSQLEQLKPDIVYFQDIWSLPFHLRRELKNRIPSVKLVVMYKGFPGHLDKLEGSDLLISCTPGIVQQFQDTGIKTSLVYHGFDEYVLSPNIVPNKFETKKNVPFSFVGSSGFGTSWEITHIERYWLLVELLMRTGLQAWVYEPDTKDQPVGPVDKLLRTIGPAIGFTGVHYLCGLFGVDRQPSSGPLSKALKEARDILLERRKLKHDSSPHTNKRTPPWSLKDMFPSACHDAVFGLDMYQILSRSMITLNKHTNCINNEVGNMRLFEATGMGTCLLTDRGANLGALFEEDKEVMAYGSAEECIEKANYLMDHPNEAERIAKAGREKTLAHHTIKHRASQIDDEIQKQL